MRATPSPRLPVARRPAGAAAVLLAILLVGALWLARSTAPLEAQPACTAEQEPNDDPAATNPIADAACVEGQLDGSDKDTFVWTVSQATARQRWTLELEGAPNQKTVVGIFRLDVDEAGDDEPTGVDELATFEDRPGSAPLRVEDLLLRPGTYHLQVAGSDEETYRLRISAGAPLPTSSEQEPNDGDEAGNPVDGAIALAGDLADSDDWFAWTLSEADARQRWQLTAQGPIGEEVRLDLHAADGEALDDSAASQTGRARLYDLGLDAGTYLVKLGPEQDGPTPYALEAVPLGERTDDREDEPNDGPETADPIAPGQQVTGRLAGDQDADFYRVAVDAELASQRFDVTLTTAAGASRRLCLLDGAGTEMQCREREGSIALAGLTLAPGDYALSVSGTPDPTAEYALRVDPLGVVPAGFEAEPNDDQATAAPLGEGHAVRGRLVGSETDVFRFAVEGAPQLWRIQVVGTGVASIAYLNAGGEEVQRREAAEGAGLVRLSNLFLLPGEHWIAVRGADATYALRAIPIGPPDPQAEREPNDDATRAQVLEVGESRTGLLLENDDRDVYRFFLAAAEHVALRIDPPPDGAVAFALDWGGSPLARRSGQAAGQSVVYEAWLQPGDYAVAVGADEPSAAEYTIVLERRDPFALPADLEPNDTAAEARPLPPALTVAGTVGGDDADWYRLPDLSRATTVAITRDGDVELALVAGDAAVDLEDDADRRVLRGDLPAGTSVSLRVTGDGDYALTLAFTEGPAAQPEPAPLAVALSLDTGQGSVAAYLAQGQRLEGRLTLVNEGTLAQDLTLDVVSSHYAWQPALARSMLRLAAGESASVPLTVRVAPDAWADQPVRVTVRATAADGALRTVATELVARRDAAPVDPEQVWPLPDVLIGGLNVAWSALGSEPVAIDDGRVAEPDEELAKRQAGLHDGTTPLDVGFRWDASDLPLTLTVDLAGDEPVPVVGVVLIPQAGSERGAVERLRGFDVLVSTDGADFREVYSGELSPLPVEQGFVFDAPVPARYAQLRLRSTYETDPDAVILAEWKVIAAPRADPLGAGGFNLADPARGGHLVWAGPQLGDEPADAAAMLTEEAEGIKPAPPADATAEWVIGFHHDRAAQITEIQWVDPPDSDPGRRFAAVEVSVSRESPVGPWESLGTWTLERGGEGLLTFVLTESTWARYVRFSASGPASETDAREYPATIRVVERAIDDTYRSILGEWGHDGRDGIYEALEPVATGAAAETDVDDAPEQARPLSLGEAVAGEVQIETDVDWYRVAVPAGQNTLRFTVAGNPTVGVEVTLQDENGQTVELRTEESLPGQTVLSASVEPGRTYLVRVAEPPRAVVFAFDTSDSVEAYLPTIYGALASFADDVAPGQEVANFLPFEAELLLAEWGDQPYALQAALNNAPLTTPSSAAEPTLQTAATALGTRPGTKAIVLITDGDSPGYPDTEALWSTLGDVQPRVFAVHLQLGEEHYQDRARQQDTLQDWASVNGGHYGAFRTQGELDVAFDRAATSLRRPTGYVLTAVATFEEPLPGSIRVVAAAGPDDESGGTVPLARGVAVELILDTSGSMLEEVEPGRTRIDAAKEVLTDLVTTTLPPGTPLVVRAFGTRPGSCGTRRVVRLAPLDPDAVAQKIAGVEAYDDVKTPLAAGLAKVVDDLAEATGPKIVVLVTDGGETCGGDPAAAIRSLVERGIEVHVNIVGFAVDDEALKAQFRDWARVGNGVYVDATSAEELGRAVTQAVQPPFRVLDDTGDVVAVGVVGGDAVAVPAGVYTVEVLTDPPQVFEAVAVEAEEGAVVTLESGT